MSRFFHSSKDALIRVWDRRTLKFHRTLRGHEGPVNAVGLQSEPAQCSDNALTMTQGGRVVSASGDGKMILWDIESGVRLRTFEGHDRGLACIEFKVRIRLFFCSMVCIDVPCSFVFICRMT